MTPEQVADHKRLKARERQQRKREQEKLTGSMTPAERQQRELDLEQAEIAKLNAIMKELGG